MPMWTLETPWYELVTRGTVMYFFMFLLMRIWGKKHLAEVSAFDFILLLFISESVQNSLVDDDKSILGGMIVISTLLFWSVVINKLTFRSRRIEKLADGTPKILIKNGILFDSVLKKQEISEQELFQALREGGVTEIKDVKQATIESNGHISVVQNQ